MTVQDILTLITEAVETLQKEQQELRERQYTGHELITHTTDAMKLFENQGAIRELQGLKLKILLDNK